MLVPPAETTFGDVDCQLTPDIPVGVDRRSSAVGVNHLKVGKWAGGHRQWKAKLAGKNGEILHRRRIVVGDGAGAARGIGGHRIGITPRHLLRYELVDAGE